MEQVHYLSRSLDETRAIAQRLLDAGGDQGIFALTGDLGAGKTAFVQLAAQNLGITEPVTSPTFTLVQEYPLTKGGKLVHSDFYRLQPEESRQLGLEDYFHTPKTLVFVEW